VTDAEPRLAFKRAFAWGILLVSDSQTKAIPELDHQAVVTASKEALAIVVHHAADVPYGDVPSDQIVPESEVAVRIYVQESAPRTPSFEAVMSVPSGTLTVGDADHEESLDIDPGRWHVRVVCTPWDHADEVDLWLLPVG
jgi:hypothetical protein